MAWRSWSSGERPAVVRQAADHLEFQIANELETLLILVTKQGDSFLGHKSCLKSVHFGKPTEKLLEAAPAYYKELDALAANLWFTVTAPFKPADLRQFAAACKGNRHLRRIEDEQYPHY